MLLTQKFHSLSEIDPEFISAIEALMHEHWSDFEAWKKAEAQAPADVTFNYWLFFGPTQNSPVGISQVMLEKINADLYLPWWKKVTSLLDKNIDQWKIARWQLAQGADGSAIFDARFARTGREKLIELFKEVESRKDVIAMSILAAHGQPSPKPSWPEIFHQTEATSHVLKPWVRSHKAYQDYLASLPEEMARNIQSSWKSMHKDQSITLGDYPTMASRKELFEACRGFDRTSIEDYPGGILTFQKNDLVLGYVRYHQGQQGTLFIEPTPLEPQGQEIVTDDVYVQYGLLKAHEMSEIKKVIVVRQGSLFKLGSQAEVEFFKAQGFITSELKETFWSRSSYIK